MFLRGPTEPLELPRSRHVSAKARLRSLEKGKRALGLKSAVVRKTLRNAMGSYFLESGPLRRRRKRACCKRRGRTGWQARCSFEVDLSMWALCKHVIYIWGRRETDV
jgi:hypothetical protein